MDYPTTSTAANGHGTWQVRHYPADRMGAPAPPSPQCSYCGSITPELFLEAIRGGAKISGSDWKYGWPHKFYVDVPNPNPEEQRICGRGFDGADILGTYPVLHLKFYSEHLEDWPALREQAVRDDIARATGIRFEQADEPGAPLKYSSPCHGYQAF